MNNFTSRYVADEFKIKLNTLHYYVEAGVIEPANPGSGTGTKRFYSPKNLLEILILKYLLDLGFQKKNIIKFFNGLKSNQAWKNFKFQDDFCFKQIFMIYLFVDDGNVKNEIGIIPISEKKIKNVSIDSLCDALKGKNKSKISIAFDSEVGIFTAVNLSAIYFDNRISFLKSQK